ncbi:hypothetical protein EYM_05215 [Ignicoccus islandicus DSM 13165]|uniref:Uncharacterized protein n=1 Tax=Ignicoccus islandicus DSM 13165 TaxID=940295 RepID=A0A0U3F980_9CREN|nr:hypothetical protein [Ignicoccus islandicus]ALU12568.1 hypothetical protein EYM_05215 [Ignicoccus islandicus DSM 13165]
MKKGSSELLAVALLAAVVIGLATGIIVTWNKQTASSRSQLDVAEMVRKASSYTLDCLGNYLFAFDPNNLKVYDLNNGTSLSYATYCYSNLPRIEFTGYATIELECNGKPLFYVVPGTFKPTIINDAKVFVFIPSVSTLIPKASCSNPTFTGFAYFHVKLPTGLEKIALCYVDNVQFEDSSGSEVSAWAVRSCVGA